MFPALIIAIYLLEEREGREKKKSSIEGEDIPKVLRRARRGLGAGSAIRKNPGGLARASKAKAKEYRELHRTLEAEYKPVKDEIYFDLETLRLSAEVDGGWRNIKDFGLAVAVTWDQEHQFRHWYEGDAKSLITELRKFSRIVTFNGDGFDFEVLRGYAPIRVPRGRSLDLLSDLNRKLGHRVSLDHVGEQTLGRYKSGSGLDAIKWWRAGNRKKVVRYCENDVQLLVDLVAFARKHRHILVESHHRQKKVPVKW
ncbi:MAG: ribonuclease H-like domain-containing protein [Acidobacteria bacterium]|nr:ribonuclease H-like domain-containing protein [Acidobacteriota bacterium]